MKRCSKCGRELPLSEFYKNKGKKDGLMCWCKDCCKAHGHSSRGKTANAKKCKKYQGTEKGKAAHIKRQAKYASSEKGKATTGRHKQR